MWIQFWCPCGRPNTMNGNMVCRTCHRRMVFGWKGELVIEHTGEALHFVPHPEGRSFVKLLHTDEKIAGAWFPMAAGVHKKPDRRRRVSDPVRDNGPVIRRKVAVG